DHEAPGGVDQVLGLLRDHVPRQHRLHDLLHHRLGERLVGDVFAVLGGYDDGVDVVRFAVDVAHGNLGFGVGPQPRQPPVAADLTVTLHQPVGVVDRHRHQLRRLVAGETEHEALVARALVEIEALALVDALRDVGRLLVVAHQHAAALVVEADRGIVVADALDDFPRHLRVVDARARRDLPRHDDEPGMR